MIVLEEADEKTIGKVLDALSSGLRKVEAETENKLKVTGYYITDKQIRIDIQETK